MLLWVMLSRLMSVNKMDNMVLGECEQVTRLFLTCCKHADRQMRKATGRTKPFWLTAYNFACLLNMPEQMKLLGPLRNRWEGGVRGEGHLRKTKSITQGKRMNWASNCLTNLLRQNCLQMFKSTGKEFWHELALFW